MILFFSKDLSNSDALLEEDEFHHCCKVLRHKTGDQIVVTDGKGSRAEATITSISKRAAQLGLSNLSHTPAKETHITLAVSPPKNRARWEWLIEKAVELGADTIIPLKTQRSERQKINLERSRKIMRSAALQSLRAYHPQLEESLPFSSLLEETRPDTDKYLAHYLSTNSNLTALDRKNLQAIILIGPEGDFTEEEVLAAQTKGYITCNISTHRLRTETAAIAVVDQLKVLGY